MVEKTGGSVFGSFKITPRSSIFVRSAQLWCCVWNWMCLVREGFSSVKGGRK